MGSTKGMAAFGGCFFLYFLYLYIYIYIFIIIKILFLSEHQASAKGSFHFPID